MPLLSILIIWPTYTVVSGGMATLQERTCCKEMYFGHLTINFYGLEPSFIRIGRVVSVRSDTEWEDLKILNLNI